MRTEYRDYARQKKRIQVMYTGEYTPNYGMMGMESSIPQGTGRAVPYASTPPDAAAPMLTLEAMGGGAQDSATSNIGYRGTSGPYRPEMGRADRLGANIVGGPGEFDSMADGGYSGGATHRI